MCVRERERDRDRGRERQRVRSCLRGVVGGKALVTGGKLLARLFKRPAGWQEPSRHGCFRDEGRQEATTHGLLPCSRAASVVVALL